MWSSADTNPTRRRSTTAAAWTRRSRSTLDVTVHRARASRSRRARAPTSTRTASRATTSPSSSNGGYAIYPVLSNNVLIDNVGRARRVRRGHLRRPVERRRSIKNSEALFNVAGFEIENTDDADVYDNVAHCNTGGFLDLRPARPEPVRRRDAHLRQPLRATTTRRTSRRAASSPACRRASACSSSATTSTRSSTTRSSGTAASASSAASHELARRQHRQSRQAHGPLSRGRAHPRQHVHHQRHARRSRPRRGVIVCARRHRPGLRLGCRRACRPASTTRTTSLLPGADPDQGCARCAERRHVRPDRRAHRLGRHVRPRHACTNPLGSDPASIAEFAAILDANGKPQYTGSTIRRCRYNAYKFASRRRAARRSSRTRRCVGVRKQHVQRRQPHVHELRGHRSDRARRTPTSRTARAVRAEHARPDRRARSSRPTRPAPARTAAADAGGDRGDLRQPQRQRDQPRGAARTTARSLAVQPVRRIRPIRAAARTRAALRFELTTQLFSDYATEVPLRVPAAGPAGDLARGQRRPRRTRRSASRSARVIAKTFAFPNGAERGGRRDAPLDPPQRRRAAARTGRAWRSSGTRTASGNRTDAHLAIARRHRRR